MAFLFLEQALQAAGSNKTGALDSSVLVEASCPNEDNLSIQ